MAKHDQRLPGIERAIKKCVSCIQYECKRCIDVGRKAVFGDGVIELCACDHSEQFSS